MSRSRVIAEASKACALQSFFFNDTATTEIYTLSLHDALSIFTTTRANILSTSGKTCTSSIHTRSEEHTSELQSPCNLVCRLLLAKKNRTHPLLPMSSAATHRTRRGPSRSSD